MSKAEIERFVTDVQADPELQAAFAGKSFDGPGLVTVARERGYDFTTEEVDAHVRAKTRELSEEELDGAAGGAVLLVSTELYSGATKAKLVNSGGSTGGSSSGGSGTGVLISGIVGIVLL